MNYKNRGRNLAFETASLSLGIMSIICCTCIYISIIAGALAILFGLLSKGGTNSMTSRALTGLVLGVVGIIITIIFYAVSIGQMLQQFGSFENILKYYCDMTGLDYEDLYGTYTTELLRLF